MLGTIFRAGALLSSQGGALGGLLGMSCYTNNRARIRVAVGIFSCITPIMRQSLAVTQQTRNP